MVADMIDDAKLTVRFASAVCVLDAFQKKSKKGIATLQANHRLIDQRLCDADGCTRR